MWRWLTVLMAAALLISGCADDRNTGETPSTDVSGPYLPDAPEEGGPYAGITATNHTLGVFPSDAYTVEDDTTYTGRRVDLQPADNDPILTETASHQGDLARLNSLDGFGTSAGGWIRFTNTVDKSTVIDGQSAIFGYIEGDTVHVVPSEVLASKDQVAFRPALPLPPMAQGFMATTTAIQDTDGNAFQPLPGLTDILSGTYVSANVGVAETLAARIDASAQKLVDAGIIEDKSALNSLSVFTAQSIYQTDRAVAQKILQSQPEITDKDDGDARCELLASKRLRKCIIHIKIENYTTDDDTHDDNTIADDAADNPPTRSHYTMRAVIYLPLPDAMQSAEDNNADGDDVWLWNQQIPDGGYPVAIFGHGLNGNATKADQIAKYIAPMGIATIGVDAPQHGKHPMRNHPSGSTGQLLQDLFGITTDNSSMVIDAFKLRDAWRQSNFDKLGLVQAIKEGIDVDGDGTIDLNPQKISYLGASLGAIQGSEFLALSPDLNMGILAVDGGRMSDFLRYPGTVQILALLVAPNLGPAAMMRTLVLLQTLVEKGDDINWAPHVIHDRFPDAGEPFHLAMEESVPDEVVPSQTGLTIMRALGVPIIGTTWLPDPFGIIEQIPPEDTPVAQNGPNGITIGGYQSHWMHKFSHPDEWTKTSHASSPTSIEAIGYWKHIFHTMYTDGYPTLIDPFKDQRHDFPTQPEDENLP